MAEEGFVASMGEMGIVPINRNTLRELEWRQTDRQ
jgi:hypothetical protein